MKTVAIGFLVVAAFLIWHNPQTQQIGGNEGCAVDGSTITYGHVVPHWVCFPAE